MIIDFHTHTYPDKIAEMVIKKLTNGVSNTAFTNGTEKGLEESCIGNQIDKAVVLPVVTNPKQVETVNRIAIETNMKKGKLISFGGLHPDNTEYRRIIHNLEMEGVAGIKLHPIFQGVDFDDIKYLRIMDCAYEYGLIVSVHAGLDVTNPTLMTASVEKIRKVLKAVTPRKLILAHMGGHLCWNEAEGMLADYLASAPLGSELYLDTAFSLPSPIASQNVLKQYDFLSNEQFLRLVRLIGADHVLFGTDSPWTDQGPSIDAVRNSGLTEKEISRILYENGRELLSL